MGGGSYDYMSRSTRTMSYKAKSRDEIFTSESRRTNKVTQDLDIRGKVRECFDLEGEHDRSFPVIIALDVTGSMGHVPERLVKRDFPEIMKKIIDAGVKDAQVCFMAIGDHECDYVPIQVGQFEASDELLDNWLTRLYLEGGGGSNIGESYLLAWAVAARQVKTHAWEKRHQKGVLITIGDEENLRTVPSSSRDTLLGIGQGPINDRDILDEAREKWNVYHINLMDYAGKSKGVQDYWTQLLGDHLINTQTSNGSDIIDIIPKLVIDAYNEQEQGCLEDEEDNMPELSSEGSSNKKDDDPFFAMAAMMAMQQMAGGNGLSGKKKKKASEEDLEAASM